MAVELRTNVIIGGRTDSSFDALAAKIASIAAAVDAIGGPLREFGSDALDTFKDYETYMLEAKGAMSANYDSASKLEKEYAALQTKAQEWAASTIFHTDDVAQAISEAAHAGWDYKEMLAGIPNAMLLAQAGNITLSSGLDYLIKTINGTGTAFEDSRALVDQWVMAANSSATTVDELGQAMLKMGATARFGDSNAELLALLGTLANAGAVGTEAGTLLRNTMIRLIAPTEKAGAAMDILGASADEIESVLADTSITKAAKQLKGLGFSAYDAEGNLKPMIQIFQDLNECLSGLNEQTQNQLLSAIFPTRTITGARAILEAISELPALYDKILGSNGYAERVAEIQTSGLMGAQERFFSKWEEFQRKIGEELAPQMESVYSFAGGIVDNLNGMDPVLLSTLTGMFEGIALAGPVLSGVATTMFAIRHLGVAGTGVLLAAAGVGALAGYLNKIHEMELENTFGSMTVNLTDIGEALSGVSQDLAAQMESFASYGEAAKAAAAAYEEAGTTLTESLWTKMATGAKIEKGSEDYNALVKGGEDMIAALKEGVTKATEEKIKFTDYLFGTNVFDEANKESDPLYASLMSLITAGYDDAIAKAEQKGQELRKAMLSAFSDGKLSSEELSGIQQLMAELNEIQSAIGGYDYQKELELRRSQRVSYDSLKDFTEQNKTAREQAAAALQDEWDAYYAQTKVMGKYAVDNGIQLPDPETGKLVTWTPETLDRALGLVEQRYAARAAQATAAFDDMILSGWDNGLATSELSETYKASRDAVESYQSGKTDLEGAYRQFFGGTTNKDASLLQEVMGDLVDLYGGTDKILSQVETYRKAGGSENLARANYLEWARLMANANSVMQDYVLEQINKGDTGQAETTQDVMERRTSEPEKETAKSVEALSEAAEQQRAAAEAVSKYVQTATDAETAQRELVDKINGTQSNALAQGNGVQAAMQEGVNAQAAQQQAEAEKAVGTYVEQNNAAMQERVRQMETLQGQATRYQKQVDVLSEKSNSYAAQMADLTNQLENHPPTASGLPQKQLQEQIDSLAQVKQSIDEQLAASQDKLTAVQEQMSELQAELNVETNADEAAAGIAAAAAGPYQAEVDVIYNDPGFTPSGGGTITIDVVYNDSGDPGGSFVSTGSTSKSGNSGGIFGQMANTLSSWQSSIKNKLSGLTKHAEGGRSDVAAIFGEDGPEWAIPEKHSDRTAELLNAARQASGFTWNELIARYGGLGGRADGVVVTIENYAPIIHADNADGVEQKLLEDKDRLKGIVSEAVRDAMERNALHDAIEVYA